MGAGVQTIDHTDDHHLEEHDSIRQIPPGKIAIWWFLASEIMVFGGLITAFVLFSFASHGGFAADAVHVKWKLGAVNTLVLVTSSLTMILALGYARMHNAARTRLCLFLTIALGLTFLGIKSYEYSSEIHEGFVPSAGLFWAVSGLMIVAAVIGATRVLDEV